MPVVTTAETPSMQASMAPGTAADRTDPDTAQDASGCDRKGPTTRSQTVSGVASERAWGATQAPGPERAGPTQPPGTYGSWPQLLGTTSISAPLRSCHGDP